MRREVTWDSIIEAGKGIISTIEKMYQASLPETFSSEVLDLKRVHYGKLFEELCKEFKGSVKKKKSKQATAIELAAKRAIYRYDIMLWHS